jgi:hypothetical protein
MIVDTGPNASMSCTPSDPQGSSVRITIGDMKAPLPATGETSGSPLTIRADLASSATAARTPTSWLRLASAPIVTPSSRGLPIRTRARRSFKAASTASICSPAPWRGGWRCISAPP